MAHEHHSHDDASSYYLEQLCTIGIAAAIGGVALAMWQRDMLRFILKAMFYPYVLLTGITLLVLVVIRAVALWTATGRAVPDHAHEHDHSHAHCDHEHGHDHEHGEDCGHHHHEHEPAAACAADHGHDCGHEHGFTPWRYAVLLLPVGLYFLDLPNDGLRPHPTGTVVLEDSGTATMARKGNGVQDLAFLELERAARLNDRREELAGTMGRLRGQFDVGAADNTCRLSRYKISCCAADAIQLNAIIVAPEPLTGRFQLGQWVEVTGQIQFRKRKDRDEFLPVLQVGSRNDIRPIDPEANPYLQ